MTILEIISGRKINGAVVHCLALLEELVERGHRAILMCPPGSWIAGQLAGRRLAVELMPSDLHRWPTDDLRRVAKILRQQRIDVVHTHMSRAHFFGVLLRWLTGTPCVATAHSNHFQLHWMFNDRVIANSNATRRFQQGCNFVRSNRIETIPMFIDRRHLAQPRADSRQRARALLGLDPCEPLVGIVGNVRPRKGIEYAIGAMPRVLAAVPSARLAIIGNLRAADYVARVQSAAERLGAASRVLWLGHRDDVREILPAIDVYVQPSIKEPLGLSILDAMVSGLPVVATRVGGIPEVVVPGRTGLLVPPARSDALAEAIVAMLGDPARRREFGRAGRQRALDEFSPGCLVPRIEAVLAGAVRSRRAA